MAGMTEFLIVAPILPGKREEWRRMMREVTGPRYEEWADHHMRMGVSREVVWEQRLPVLDLAVVAIDGDDPQDILGKMTVSDKPFDVWFRDTIISVTGYLENAPEEIPAPTLVGKFEAGTQR
ncbi:MAG: hypothetical protein OXF41_13045 [bacterium]|nr:hypothetical protein [bacterium]